MREIEFRGRDFAGTWWHGFLSSYEGNPVIHPLKAIGASMLVDPKTVGQYTGRMDQKRDKIFEGDIIDVTDYEGDVTAGQNRTGLVMWDDKRLAFVIKFTDGEVLLMSDIDCGDYFYSWVIGNIFDTPELMRLPRN